MENIIHCGSNNSNYNNNSNCKTNSNSNYNNNTNSNNNNSNYNTPSSQQVGLRTGTDPGHLVLAKASLISDYPQQQQQQGNK